VAELNALKPLHWIGSSLADLRAFPDEVGSVFGFAVFQAQFAGKHVDAKPLKGFGDARVLEISVSCLGSAYRAVYTVRLRHAIYFLHVFQKKSK
jgi:phage-related protein